MIQINLLPKNYLKRQSSFNFGKTGLYVAAGAVGVLVMLAVVTFYQMRQINALEAGIERANERAAMLQKDIKLVDALIDVKTKINHRLEAVERLDRHRSVWVRVLQDVSSDVPDFVWLTELRQKAPDLKPNQNKNSGANMPDSKAGKENSPEVAGPVKDTLHSFDQAEIEGHAFTLNALAAFMINLMRSDYFDDVELVSSKEVKFTGNEKAYNFVVSCNVHYLTDEQLRATVAQRGNEADDLNEADYEEAAPPAPNESALANENGN
jgi:Tfp pilus assembly protein PilN